MAEMVRLVQTGRKLGKLNQCPFRSVIPVNPNHDRYDRFFSLLLRPSLLLSVSPELSPPSFSVLLQISGRVSSISSLFVVSFLRRSDSSREAPDSSSSIFSAEICEDLRRHSSTTVVSLPSSSPPNQSFAASAPSCLSSCSVADLRFNLQSPSPSSSRLSSVKTREASSSATSQAVDETPVSGIFCPSLAVHQLRRKTRAPPEIASFLAGQSGQTRGNLTRMEDPRPDPLTRSKIRVILLLQSNYATSRFKPEIGPANET